MLNRVNVAQAPIVVERDRRLREFQVSLPDELRTTSQRRTTYRAIRTAASSTTATIRASIRATTRNGVASPPRQFNTVERSTRTRIGRPA